VDAQLAADLRGAAARPVANRIRELLERDATDTDDGTAVIVNADRIDGDASAAGRA